MYALKINVWKFLIMAIIEVECCNILILSADWIGKNIYNKMGVGPSAILGSTNKFFMPWLVPRNQKDTVYAPSIFGKLSTGRKRREIETAQVAQEVISCKSIKLWYTNIND